MICYWCTQALDAHIKHEPPLSCFKFLFFRSVIVLRGWWIYRVISPNGYGIERKSPGRKSHYDDLKWLRGGFGGGKLK